MIKGRVRVDGRVVRSRITEKTNAREAWKGAAGIVLIRRAH